MHLHRPREDADRVHHREEPMKLSRFAVPAAALVALVAAGVAPAAVRSTTVKVTAKDYSFTLSTKTVKHGKVTFMIKNAGHTAHDFSIAGHTSKQIGPGKSTTLTVMLKKGRYPYSCTVDSHKALGMKGVLQVT
jgi:plastocyanin